MSDQTAPTDPAGNADAKSARSPAGPPVDFTTLTLSLHEGALMAMGVKEGAEGDVDLAAAHYQIDILAMLQEKTSGNLTEDEDRLLRTVLYELRTAYVRAKEG